MFVTPKPEATHQQHPKEPDIANSTANWIHLQNNRPVSPIRINHKPPPNFIPSNPSDVAVSSIMHMTDQFVHVMEKLVPKEPRSVSYQQVYRKLPDLPYFSGEIVKWPLFKAELEQSTKQWHIKDVENMSRLRECLKGDALEAVQSLMVHEDNVAAHETFLE